MPFQFVRMKNYFWIVFCFILQVVIPEVFSFRQNSTEEFLHHTKFGIREPHIVGGKEVHPHSHPHQVGILLAPNVDDKFCGGSLLSEFWVVTAAHCTDFPYILDVGVVLGSHKIRENEREAQVIPIEKVHQHPEYDPTNLLHDISLIRLAFEASLNNYVQPIRLPSQTQKTWSFWNSEVTVTGWGYVSDNDKKVSSVLRGAETRVVTNFFCTMAYLFQSVFSSNICTSGWYSKGTCNGDSGGPLTLKEGDGMRTLIGISSYGVGFGCSKSWPVVFTRVTSHLDWIHKTTEIPQRH